MEEITKRITQIIRDKKLTNGAFADAIGIKRPIISHVLSGRNKPSLHVILQILETYPEIDPSWLLLGKTSNPNGISRKNPDESDLAPVNESAIEEIEHTSNSTEEKSNLPSTLLLIEGEYFRIVKHRP